MYQLHSPLANSSAIMLLDLSGFKWVLGSAVYPRIKWTPTFWSNPLAFSISSWFKEGAPGFLFKSRHAQRVPSMAIHVCTAPAEDYYLIFSGKFTLSLVNLFMFTQNGVLWCKRYLASALTCSLLCPVEKLAWPKGKCVEEVWGWTLQGTVWGHTVGWGGASAASEDPTSMGKPGGGWGSIGRGEKMGYREAQEFPWWLRW